MARTTDPCAGLRKRVAASEARLAELLKFLKEAPISERPRIREEIKQERAILRRLTVLLRACERQHAGGGRPS
jgi:hypothetical protein